MSSKTFYSLPLLFGTGILLLSSCGHPFVPSNAANTIPGEKRLGEASASGVSMQVKVDTWNGDPVSLREVLTPVSVIFSNEGTHPVALRYRYFTIKNSAGVKSEALPPFQIRGTVDEVAPAFVPGFGYRNFSLYPRYRFGGGMRYWADDWGWDNGWYQRYYGLWQRSLPTQDMLNKAIPEGVLQSGGRVEGYLYFQKVPDNAPSLEFDATLMDAQTHKQFATLRIPFEREGSSSQ